MKKIENKKMDNRADGRSEDLKKIENKKVDIRTGGRSENLGRQSIIQALLKEEVLLLIRPKSGRAKASPSPLIPKELNIQWLPNEVLLKIFSYLSLKEMITVLSKVCKRFQELTRNEQLWTRINLSEKSVDFKFVEYALNHGAQYLSLHRTRLHWQVPSHFRKQSKLKYLDMRHRAEGSELELGNVHSPNPDPSKIISYIFKYCTKCPCVTLFFVL